VPLSVPRETKLSGKAVRQAAGNILQHDLSLSGEITRRKFISLSYHFKKRGEKVVSFSARFFNHIVINQINDVHFCTLARGISLKERSDPLSENANEE
jgi:hypothetical protein